MQSTGPASSHSSAHKSDGNHGLSLQPNQAKALVCVLGVLVFVFDVVTPADVDISIFYGFVIVLCAWTRSLAFLWGTTIVFGAAILPSLLLAPQPVTARSLASVLWVNRLLAMAALALVAGLLHVRIRDFRQLENLNQELHTAVDEIKTLRGVLLICSYCKKIEANPETWVDLENYVRRHSDAEFNHGVCPDCLRKVTQKTS
jgi:hypothetical protein